MENKDFEKKWTAVGNIFIKKGTRGASEIFDKVYEHSLHNQLKIKDARTPFISMEYWETLCHKFALMAAHAYEDYVKDSKDLNK